MTDKEYRLHPAVSRSELWQFSKSPEKFQYFKEHPEQPTDALIFGQLFHKLVLEPEKFFREFAIEPEVNRRTKAGKAQAESFRNSYNGLTIVSREQYNLAWTMRESLLKVPYVKQLLSGEHEVPYFWTDAETGEACKCRADCVTDVAKTSFVVDLKTTEDAETQAFTRSALKYGYDFQDGMYKEGIDLCRGKNHIFIIIAVEKKPPYAVNIIEFDELVYRRGNQAFHDVLKQYHKCKVTNNWYGYLGEKSAINKMYLPAWLARDVE